MTNVVEIDFEKEKRLKSFTTVAGNALNYLKQRNVDVLTPNVDKKKRMTLDSEGTPHDETPA